MPTLRTMVRCLSAGALAHGAIAHAQAAPMRVALSGVAWDSVRARPLADAFVTLDGARSTNTDGRGTFRFDSVDAGTHLVAVQHTALDSLGLSGLAARVAAGPGAPAVRVATPSFAALWRGACGDRPVPRDSGFVFGVVTDAANTRPLAGATIGLTWLDVSVDKKRSIQMQQFAGAGIAGRSGTYAICGVPNGLGLRVQAQADSLVSGVIELVPTPLPIRRVDLALGSPAMTTGTIVGRIVGLGGAPLPNARIVVDGESADIRTDDAGRFIARGVPAGSRQIEALSIGMSPAASIVRVAAGDTAHFDAELHRVPTLDRVLITASSRARHTIMGVEERRRTGLAYMRDSSQINQNGLLSTVFDAFPSTQVVRGRGGSFSLLMRNGRGQWCQALVFIDGVLMGAGELNTLQSDEIAVIEAYPHGTLVPAEFASRTALTDPCGAAVVWTKRSFK